MRSLPYSLRMSVPLDSSRSPTAVSAELTKGVILSASLLSPMQSSISLATNWRVKGPGGYDNDSVRAMFPGSPLGKIHGKSKLLPCVSW